MIESISERTNQVARLCQALKSPKKSSLKTATPTLDNDEEVMDYEEGDVVDEINKSFTRSSANELPSTTASQATMQILLIEIRTLIREFQENRRHQTSQPAPIPTTASFPSNDVHKTGAAIAEAPSSAPLAHTGGDHHDLLKIDAPVAPTSPTPFSTPAPSFPDSPVLSPYSPPPFSPASSPKSPPLTVAPLEASLPNTSEFNEPLRPPVAPLNRPPYDPNKYLPEIVRESVESTKLTLNDLVPHFAKKRREAKLNRLKKLPHKGDDRPIKQPSFPQREATIMAKTYSPVKTLSPRCNFKERALNSKMPCLRGSEAKRKAAVSPPFVYDRPSARAAHVHPTKAEVRVQYRPLPAEEFRHIPTLPTSPRRKSRPINKSRKLYYSPYKGMVPSASHGIAGKKTMHFVKNLKGQIPTKYPAVLIRRPESFTPPMPKGIPSSFRRPTSSSSSSFKPLIPSFSEEMAFSTKYRSYTSEQRRFTNSDRMKELLRL